MTHAGGAQSQEQTRNLSTESIMQLGEEFPAVLVAVFASYVPLLCVHTVSLWGSLHYRYVPCLLFVATALIWQRLPEGRRIKRLQWLEMLTFGLAAVLLLVSVWSNSPWIAAASLVLTTGSLLVFMGGAERLSALAAAWLLLWFVLPLPFRWDERLVAQLEALTAKNASLLLDAFGMDHFLTGRTVELAGGIVRIDSALDGLRTVFALVGFSAAYSVWKRLSAIRAIMLMLSAVFWLAALAALRIVVVVWLSLTFSLDASQGIAHLVIGASTLLLTLMLLASTNSLVGHIAWVRQEMLDERVARSREPASSGKRSSRRSRRRRRLADNTGLWNSRAVAGVFAALVIAQGVMWFRGDDSRKYSVEQVAALEMPQSLGAWKLAGAGENLSHDTGFPHRHSRVAAYRLGNDTIELTIDFPLRDAPVPGLAYLAEGWNVDALRTETSYRESRGGKVWSFDMQRSNVDFGCVALTQFDTQLRIVSPSGRVSTGSESGDSRTLSASVPFGRRPEVFRLQAFMRSDVPIDADMRRALCNTVSELRATIFAVAETDLTGTAGLQESRGESDS